MKASLMSSVTQQLRGTGMTWVGVGEKEETLWTDSKEAVFKVLEEGQIHHWGGEPPLSRDSPQAKQPPSAWL